MSLRRPASLPVRAALRRRAAAVARRFGRRTEGSMAVEFGLLAPLILALLALVVELSWRYYVQSEAETAVAAMAERLADPASRLSDVDAVKGAICASARVLPCGRTSAMMVHVAELTATTPLARGLARAEAVLSPADAAAFRAVIRRNAPVYLEDQRRLTEARRALGRDITADRFDRDETQKALDDWRAAWNQFFDDFSKTLVDALAQVSPEGRRKLVAERQSARGRFLAP